jgi:hypothetical protein
MTLRKRIVQWDFRNRWNRGEFLQTVELDCRLLVIGRFLADRINGSSSITTLACVYRVGIEAKAEKWASRFRPCLEVA